MTSKTPISRLIAKTQYQQQQTDDSSSAAALGTTSNQHQQQSHFQEFVIPSPFHRQTIQNNNGSNGAYAPDRQTSSSQNVEITAGECLVLSELDWMTELSKKSFIDCTLFLDFVASKLAPTTKTALELLSESKIPTGLPNLDAALLGGLKVGHLIEFVGRAGVGKTQFCMSISARVLLDKSAQRGVIYFDSERKLSQERFTEILLSIGGSVDDLARLTVVNASELTCQQVLQALREIEPNMIENNVGLIIVDSIAHIARGETNLSIMDRQSLLSKIATQLKFLAETFSIPVVVTNQVMGGNNNNDNNNNSEILNAALGNTWHHVVNVRLFLSQEKGEVDKRSVTITKSPDVSESVVQYSIASSGIVANKYSQAAAEEIAGWTSFFESMSPDQRQALL